MKITKEEAQKVLDSIKDIIFERALNCDEEKELLVLETTWREIMIDEWDLAYIAMDVEKLYDIKLKDDNGWDPSNSIEDTCVSIAKDLKRNNKTIL